MSPRRYCCVICGEFILDDLQIASSKWLAEFRAIYSTRDGYFISGVGLYEDQTAPLLAPSDPSKRYDGEDYDHQLTQEFYLMGFSVEGMHGCVTHDACWKFLQEAATPNEISLKRFIEICESLPLPSGLGLLDWGHTYGGIYETETDPSYVWETRLTQQRRTPTSTGPMHYTVNNPYHVPEIQEILSETAHLSGQPASFNLRAQSSDIFTRLPWEIREEIANNLSTRDALSLRTASKSFLPLMNSPNFWASRFTPNPQSDRGFVFETRKNAETRDWWSLYRLTAYSQSPRGLKNRQRIWSLVQFIIDLLKLSPSYESEVAERHGESDHTESNLVVACGDIQSFPRDENFDFANFCAGCRMLREQRVSMPQRLTGVVLSFVQYDGRRHLSGLRLISEHVRDVQLGYFSTGNSIAYKVESLKGFVLAIHSTGIRGIRVIDGHGVKSPWFGSHEDTPLTERLTVFDSIETLQVGIDGYKVVSIAASGARAEPDSSPNNSNSTIRTNALWYPSLPGADITLNEPSFQGEGISTKYRPLRWSHFGGPKGTNLPDLTNISVVAYPHPQSLDFDYKGVKVEQSHLGRYNSEQEAHELVEEDVARFPIQGPEGEFIQSVQVAMREIANREYVCALKLTTNMGKEFTRGDTAPQSEFLSSSGMVLKKGSPEAIFKAVEIAPGATITGFYANYYSHGLTNFGVISEIVKRKAISQDSI